MRRCNGIVNKFNKEKNRYEEVKFENAIFHQWGCDYDEFEDGAGNFSVAIVELEDGTVLMPRADNVKFIKKDELDNEPLILMDF